MNPETVTLPESASQYSIPKSTIKTFAILASIFRIWSVVIVVIAFISGFAVLAMGEGILSFLFFALPNVARGLSGLIIAKGLKSHSKWLLTIFAVKALEYVYEFAAVALNGVWERVYFPRSQIVGMILVVCVYIFVLKNRKYLSGLYFEAKPVLAFIGLEIFLPITLGLIAYSMIGNM